MRKKVTRLALVIGAVAAIGGGTAGVASIAGASSSGGSASPDSSGAAPSRLDDGKSLLPQAKISESDAIAAAQTAASGSLNEVDLEHFDGRLVYNVDVGSHDVKVDAATGKVLASSSDD